MTEGAAGRAKAGFPNVWKPLAGAPSMRVLSTALPQPQAPRRAEPGTVLGGRPHRGQMLWRRHHPLQWPGP